MKITCVVGTRPEFIKMFPVVAELRRRGESPQVIATGQHDSLLRGTPFEDGMAPDVNLGLPGSNDPMAYVKNCESVLIKRFREDRPDVVVVQGDTASACGGANAAFSVGIPFAHVEAGIRSGDLDDPWPEEIFRTNIDTIATERFCATEANLRNLVDGPIRFGAIPVEYGWITGNPGIDALYSHTKPVEQSQKVDRVLITLHRRESFGEPLKHMVRGISQATAKYPLLAFVWPTHPNPRVHEVLDAATGIFLEPPMDTVSFAQMLSTSRAVITDSGGVQEEAAALGVPAVIARTLTDRPESVEAGLARVVGKSEAGMLEGLQWALDTRCEPSLCFGDGHASPRIVEHLLNGGANGRV